MLHAKKNFSPQQVAVTYFNPHRTNPQALQYMFIMSYGYLLASYLLQYR